MLVQGAQGSQASPLVGINRFYCRIVEDQKEPRSAEYTGKIDSVDIDLWRCVVSDSDTP